MTFSRTSTPAAATSTRRIFLLALATTGTAALAVTTVPPAGPAGKLDENDATAKALGYVADSTKADKKKYPKFTATQKCSSCALYQGKAAEPQGACPIFSGKQVAAGGWCSSYVAKA
jgi:hypothetical protein